MACVSQGVSGLVLLMFFVCFSGHSLADLLGAVPHQPVCICTSLVWYILLVTHLAIKKSNTLAIQFSTGGTRVHHRPAVGTRSSMMAVARRARTLMEEGIPTSGTAPNPYPWPGLAAVRGSRLAVACSWTRLAVVQSGHSGTAVVWGSSSAAGRSVVRTRVRVTAVSGEDQG